MRKVRYLLPYLSSSSADNYVDPNSASVGKETRMNVINQLRRNDPATTWIPISLHRCVEEAELVAQALEQNEYITKVALYFHPSGDTTRWNSLFRVMGARENLERVSLRDETYGWHY